MLAEMGGIEVLVCGRQRGVVSQETRSNGAPVRTDRHLCKWNLSEPGHADWESKVT